MSPSEQPVETYETNAAETGWFLSKGQEKSGP
jgi:hypothetical protein